MRILRFGRAAGLREQLQELAAGHEHPLRLPFQHDVQFIEGNKDFASIRGASMRSGPITRLAANCAQLMPRLAVDTLADEAATADATVARGRST